MEISYDSSSASAVTVGGGGSGRRQVKLIPLRHPDPSSFSSSSHPIKGWLAELRQMTLLQWVELLFPCYRWIRTYKWRDYLQSDLMAGLTVGTMLVPQVCPLPFIVAVLQFSWFLVNGGAIFFTFLAFVYHVDLFLSSFQESRSLSTLFSPEEV